MSIVFQNVPLTSLTLLSLGITHKLFVSFLVLTMAPCLPSPAGTRTSNRLKFVPYSLLLLPPRIVFPLLQIPLRNIADIT